MVLWGQHRTKNPHRRHRQGSVGQPVEDEGIASHRAGRGRAIPGGVLGEIELIPAVDVERPRPVADVGLAGVELREMGHQLDGGITFSPGESLQLARRGHIRQSGRGSKDVFMHDRV